MNQVTGILILHPTFALVDPTTGTHLPSDSVLILRNVAPFNVIDQQDTEAAVQTLIGDGFQHGDHITVIGQVGLVHGQRSVLMTGVERR